MTSGITLDDFMQIVYADASKLSVDHRRMITSILRKNTIESLADMRALTMALDRQTFPTPMIIRFSESDIYFANVNGIECPIDRHDISVSVPSASSGSYEPHIVACFRRFCSLGSVVFDVGANVGVHTFMLAKLIGDAGEVWAFEPNSENCRLLLAGIEHNRFSNIRIAPIALSEQFGWTHFSSAIGSNGCLLSEKFVTLHGHSTVIPTFTIDGLPLPDAHLIKIDVEGAEFRVLSGGKEMLRRARPVIICEFSAEMLPRVSGVSPQEFLSWVGNMNYDIFLLDRISCEMLPIHSVGNFLERWGSLTRIEDLCFVPHEKA